MGSFAEAYNDPLLAWFNYLHVLRLDLFIWAQLFEGRLVLNPGLNLIRVSVSFIEKHFLG